MPERGALEAYTTAQSRKRLERRLNTGPFTSPAHPVLIYVGRSHHLSATYSNCPGYPYGNRRAFALGD